MRRTCKGRGVEDHDTKGDVLSPQEQDAGGKNGILLQGFSFFASKTTSMIGGDRYEIML